MYERGWLWCGKMLHLLQLGRMCLAAVPSGTMQTTGRCDEDSPRKQNLDLMYNCCFKPAGHDAQQSGSQTMQLIEGISVCTGLPCQPLRCNITYASMVRLGGQLGSRANARP